MYGHPLRRSALRILVLSDYQCAGGAAIAACRLLQGLAEAGTDVVHVTGRVASDETRWPVYHLGLLYRYQVLHALLTKCHPGLALKLRESTTERHLDGLLRRLRPDVINVHNLHGAAWSPRLVSLCARHAPTVWTLHDMWSFTGRCAYSYDCSKFRVGCDLSCPTPDEYPSLAPKCVMPAWKARRRLFKDHPAIVAVSPSTWLAQEAQSGLWGGHRVEVIPYGLSLDKYLPVDRGIARAALGVVDQGPVVLVAAQHLGERRKGGQLLADALTLSQTRPLTVLTLGSGQNAAEIEGVHWQPFGYIDHERTKVLAYSAADLVIHSAPVDNLPLVVMEALACGTPCIAYRVGGLPDIIQAGVSGWLADDVSAAALASVLDNALAAIAAGTDLRSTSRALAVARYSLTSQADRYLQLFQTMVTHQ